MSLFSCADKVAIVTGSSRGIGRAIALRLAEHGARVVISARKPDGCEAVAAEIRAVGGKALPVPAHIGSKVDLQRLVGATVDTWGGIDVLVCNAAVNPYYGPASGMSDDAYDRVMNANVKGNFWLCNIAMPHMIGRPDPSIIVISSIGGLRGSPTLGVYGLSKAADMQLARNIAVEFGGKGVRANCIAPGLVRTDFAKALWADAASLKKRLRDTPLGRIGEPDDIAGAAVFLASSASRFMTGQTLVIDGGVTAGAPAAAPEEEAA